MKKCLVILLSLLLTFSSSAIPAFAENEPESPGIYDVSEDLQPNLTVYKTVDKELEQITPDNGFYAEADTLKVNYTTSGVGNYVVMLMKSETLDLDESKIYYINGDNISASTYEFTIKPRTLTEGKYYIFVSNDVDTEGAVSLGSFSYIGGGEVSTDTLFGDLGKYTLSTASSGDQMITTLSAKVGSQSVTIATVTKDSKWIVGENDFKVSCSRNGYDTGCFVIHAAAVLDASDNFEGDYVYTELKSDKGVTDHIFHVTLESEYDQIIVAWKGDFNRDGEVDGNDFGPMVSVSTFETPTQEGSLVRLLCDINGDGDRDGNDYGPVVSFSTGENNSLPWSVEN